MLDVNPQQCAEQLDAGAWLVAVREPHEVARLAFAPPLRADAADASAQRLGRRQGRRGARRPGRTAAAIGAAPSGGTAPIELAQRQAGKGAAKSGHREADREHSMTGYVADVAKHTASVNEAAVVAIVKYCGIALQHVDSAQVSASDPKELATVREGFAAKKLGLTAEATGTLGRLG